MHSSLLSILVSVQFFSLWMSRQPLYVAIITALLPKTSLEEHLGKCFIILSLSLPLFRKPVVEWLNSFFSSQRPYIATLFLCSVLILTCQFVSQVLSEEAALLSFNHDFPIRKYISATHWVTLHVLVHTHVLLTSVLILYLIKWAQSSKASVCWYWFTYVHVRTNVRNDVWQKELR